jgi:hypothetical protein
MTKISISICPTQMEFNDGSRYDEDMLLAAIRDFVLARHPDATIATLQVGHRQGDYWARIDGDSEAGEDLILDFFREHAADNDLFAK